MASLSPGLPSSRNPTSWGPWQGECGKCSIRTERRSGSPLCYRKVAPARRAGVRNPAASPEYARQPKCLPRNVLTPIEAAKILDAVDASTTIGKRDRAILEIFYATGIRKEELRPLKGGDLNADEGLLRITSGKGGRDRVVPLGTMALVALQTYLAQGRPELLGTCITDQLFLSCRGHPIDPHTLGSLSNLLNKPHTSNQNEFNL